MSEVQRRQFTRIHFADGATLTKGGTHLRCEIIDLSLKGALIALSTADDALTVGQRVVLNVPLGEGESHVSMTCRVAHREAEHVGLACLDIDLDSMTHLRRLIELNLGSGDLLDRELSALIAR